MELTGNILDLHSRRTFKGQVIISNGIIEEIHEQGAEEKGLGYLLPGFVDAHVHIESSMLVPSEFARLAVVHGTVATVSDPHEIANVLGVEGVEYMLENASRVPFHFFFGAPSCVPATHFETAGAHIDSSGIRKLLQSREIRYLAEMMNYPGVLHEDEEVMRKLAIAKELGKPVDGHAPGLIGKDAVKYIQAGISTDHECVDYHEALWKLQNGMKIMIREGSAAKNFDALIDLIGINPEMIMFCSDDKHPDDLITGHINQLVAKAIELGKDLYDVLRVACVNPVGHYGLPIGLLREGDPADLIIVENTKSWIPTQTYIGGHLVADQGRTRIGRVEAKQINRFVAEEVHAGDFRIAGKGGRVRTIRAIDGSLITESTLTAPPWIDGLYIQDSARDILKLAVLNRYQKAKPALAFIQGFGLKKGAIASCVGHDSHNILVVGTDDEHMARAANRIIREKGGISAVSGKEERVLPLPVGGIMSTDDGFTVASAYSRIDRFVREELGSDLKAPFMTLSFMALLVIPRLKLSDKGLFDAETFRFVGLEAAE